jgi:hypothetical protein
VGRGSLEAFGTVVYVDVSVASSFRLEVDVLPKAFGL